MPLPSPSPPSRLSPKKSQLDIIYSENRVRKCQSDPDFDSNVFFYPVQTKSKSAQNTLSSASFSILPSLTVS